MRDRGARRSDPAKPGKRKTVSKEKTTVASWLDPNAAEIAMGCADPKRGLAILNFTGVRSASTLEIP